MYLNRLIHLTILCSLLLDMLSIKMAIAQGPLTLDRAVQMALDYDVGIEQYRNLAESARHNGMAMAQLPDPTLKLGANNLPTDTFSLDQEPMTQLSVGVSQQFPAGDSLALQSEIYGLKSDALLARTRLRRLEVVNTTRKIWFDVLYWQHVHGILQTDRKLFEQLLQITESLYSVGKKQQQDVLWAELEISRLQERILQASDQLREAKINLARWVGDLPDNTQFMDQPLPPLTIDLASSNAVAQQLARHPMLEMLDRELAQSDRAVALSQQSYKPRWGVDASYGYRDGENTDGSDRSDFFSVMVNVQLPFFTQKRQDKTVSAMRNEREAKRATYLDRLREQTGNVQAHYVRWEQLSSQRTLYEKNLLRQSKDHVEATLNAYQSNTTDFAELMRAYLGEQRTQLDYQKLITMQQKTLSELHYLYGSNDSDTDDSDIGVSR